MPLTTNVVRTWLLPFVADITGFTQLTLSVGRITDMPDRQISIMRVGGPRIIMQGAFEEILFRFQYRGKSNSLEDAEDIATKMDKFIWGSNNLMIGPVYVTSIDYGSPLRQLPSTDSQSRYNFTADYKFTASREG